MKEVVIHPLPVLRGEIREVSIPIPAHDQVVIKVVVAGSNVKDWAHITARNLSINSGDDIAGIIYALGDGAQATNEFNIGDRVAAFHPMLTAGGAYAEYATAPYHTVFKVPNNTTFEDAATIPLVACTAALSMFWQSMPMPWSPRSSFEPLPFIIYGGSSALGCFAAKLAKASNVHPIIAICRGNVEYISTILDSSKGDTIVDNRQGPESTKAAVKKALGSLEAYHALDAISANGTWISLSHMLGSGGQLSVVSGINKYDEAQIKPEITIKYTYVGAVHSGAYLSGMPKQAAEAEAVKSVPEFAYIFFRYLTRMLAQGAFEGHPYELISGGLSGVEIGLQRLKDGEARGRKFIYKISDTSSLGE